jgi:hypothetical protein
MLEAATAEHGEKAPEQVKRKLEAEKRRLTLRAEIRAQREQDAKMAEASRERFTEERHSHEAARHAKRASMTLPELVRDCEHREAVQAAASGISYGPKTSHGKSESKPPPSAPTLDSKPYRRTIENTALDWARELDAQEGVGAPRSVTRMSTEEKDTEIITRWEGIPSAVVAQRAPHLGSEQTIQRVRRKWYRHGHDGTPGFVPRAQRAA